MRGLVIIDTSIELLYLFFTKVKPRPDQELCTSRGNDGWNPKLPWLRPEVSHAELLRNLWSNTRKGDEVIGKTTLLPYSAGEV